MPCARKSTGPAVARDAARLRLEHVDEQPADRLALGLGVVDARERLEEFLGRIDMDQRDVEMAAKQADDFSASPCRNSPWSTNTQVSWSPIASWISTAATAEIDAAREAADHPRLADLGADALDRLVAEGAPWSSRP